MARRTNWRAPVSSTQSWPRRTIGLATAAISANARLLGISTEVSRTSVPSSCGGEVEAGVSGDVAADVSGHERRSHDLVEADVEAQ